MHFVQKCIFATHQMHFCNAPNAFLHQMHFCKASHFVEQNVMLNILALNLFGAEHFVLQNVQHQIDFCVHFVEQNVQHQENSVFAKQKHRLCKKESKKQARGVFNVFY